MATIIITADDFGLSAEINAAVEQAHRAGVLAAASLMVAAPAAADAVARARLLPALRVGLHVVLVQGSPQLPACEVKALVDDRGLFPDNLFRAGMTWFFSPAARRQLRREVAAQFAAFRATGLIMDHVNAHNHMHLHPTVFAAILRELRQQPGTAIRWPREPWRISWRGHATPGSRTLALLERAVMAPWLGWMRLRLKSADIAHNDWLLGRAQTGRLDEAAILRLLEDLPNGVVELYCHPSIAGNAALTSMMACSDGEAEYRALISAMVSQALTAKGLRPGGFADI
ncbi:MAG: hopanoid biosynthesis-associated protein HpnK [Sphingomonadales bacterium]